MTKKNVVIIGAGISGLTAAWWLHKKGIDVTVLEKEKSPGGTMRTIQDNGWLVETGPNSALETTPLFREMFEGLGINGQMLYADPKAERRYILRNEKLHALPTSLGAFLASSLWTLGGKLRLLKEPFVGRAGVEETVAQFVERRLGREFLDYAIDPFVAGVYAGNPEQLSVRAAFPKLYALEEKYGGLMKGMILGARERKRRAEKAKDRAKMFSFRNGMQTFPEAIAKELGERVHYGCDVLSLKHGLINNTYSIIYKQGGQELVLNSDSVVLSVPAFIASTLIREYSEELAKRFDDIYYPPVAEVFLGFQSDQVGSPLDGFGFLIPQKEKRQILGTIWSSALFPGRAPEGHVALTSFVGGLRQPALASLGDAELVDVTVGELKSLMKITGKPVYSRIMRWQKAIPQYNLGYAEVVNGIGQFEKEHQGIYFCANYLGGISVGDCVMSGERIARRIVSESQMADSLYNTSQEVSV